MSTDPNGSNTRSRPATRLGQILRTYLLALLPSWSASADSDLVDALIHGKADLFLRYRYEFVDDGSPGIQDANANTLRTALGYTSSRFYDFDVRVQLEDVRSLGRERYNDGGSNGVRDRAVVVDPVGTEFNQAFLRFSGLPKTVLSAGRQEINHRDAPLQRYVGNIAWRQNVQSFDGVRAVNLALPGTVVDYSYIWNVNRIFGEDNPLPDASDFRLAGHLVNIQYSSLPIGKLEGYSYLLDFATSTSDPFSTATVGLRIQGNQGVLPKTKLLYAAELAHQRDYGDNPNDIEVNYFLGEIGGSYAFGGILDSIVVKLTYEVLEGEGGGRAFQTPLGTNHAFQGWADRFLITPGDGIEDFFATFTANFLGAQFSAVYHDFQADHGDYAYGEEWDLILERPIAKQFLVGVKYARYVADENPVNLLNNTSSGQADDLTKFWAYIQFTY
ncbi:MAG: alginate export family protein [Gammaproteobacteria bacterium]